MGQSIYNITLQEDHERLRIYLNSDADLNWKKYFTVRFRRAGTRTESPVYESVNIMGMQRLMQQNDASCSPSSSSSSSSIRDTLSSSTFNNNVYILNKICNKSKSN